MPTAAEPAATPPVLGDLPEWDLGDLYPSPDAPELTADLDRAAAEAKALRDRCHGRVAALDGAALAAAIRDYETLQETLGRVMSYAQLVHSGDMSDPEVGRFFQSMQERTTEISTETLFFTLEINRLEEADLGA